MKLDPQSVTFTAKEGAVFLQLHQDSGITVHSKPSLLVKANDTITFAGKRVSMSAAESMRFTCGSSSIVFDGITDIQGQAVTMEGSIKAPVSVASQEADLHSALDMMGMIPVGGVMPNGSIRISRKLTGDDSESRLPKWSEKRKERRIEREELQEILQKEKLHQEKTKEIE
ncbi:hypothetical protein MKX57_15290 [Lysinibacillus sp. FSL M8-0216]|uniref:hypothetical protein n=1 Tax=Lysinibacillus sp. FSL M8-0216 TaxID=2921619 RepID=UPI00315A8FF9